MAVRDAIYIERMAHKVLRTANDQGEWYSAIYSVRTKTGDKLYGITAPRPGEAERVSDQHNTLTLREALGKSADAAMSPEIEEHAHNHPSKHPGAEQVSDINFSALAQGEIKGDKAVALATGKNVTAITPRGSILVAESKLKPDALSGDVVNNDVIVTPWNRRAEWSNSNVTVKEQVRGTGTAGNDWVPTRPNLAKEISDRMGAIRAQLGRGERPWDHSRFRRLHKRGYF